MNNKKWLISVVSCVLASLLLFGSFIFITDPLVRYDKENGLFSYYEYTEMYCNPGIARNYDYDTVLVGTSMVENTDVNEFDEVFDFDMVNLAYSGGTSYNMKTILDICFESRNKIKNVFWALDEFHLAGSYNTTRYPLPEYLYEKNHIHDLSYLLNLDIFYHYCVKNIYNTIIGNEKLIAPKEPGEELDYGKEIALSNYPRPEISDQKTDFDDEYKKTVDNNLNNIIPLIENHKNTDFTFFMVPYSILYWDNSLRNGSADAEIDSVEYAVEKLMKYDNVKIFYFQDRFDIITNLDNYRDYSHFSPSINSKMTKWMAEGSGLLTYDNYLSVLENMRTFINSYDYDSVYVK